MGKGDMRTAKGKRIRGSFGNSRPKEENLKDKADDSKKTTKK